MKNPPKGLLGRWTIGNLHSDPYWRTWRCPVAGCEVEVYDQWSCDDHESDHLAAGWEPIDESQGEQLPLF